MRNNLSSKWPYFFDAAPLSIIVALTLFSTSTMVLLLLDYLTSVAVILISIPLATAGFIISYKIFVKTRRNSEPLTRSESTVNILIFVGVFAWGLFNIFYVSQHVFVNRDPGIYTVTARWIIDNDNLNISVEVNENPNIVSTSAGFEFNPTNQKYLNAQGQHLLPVLMGLGGRILGTSAIYFTNIFFGMTALLALFAFSKNYVKPIWSLLISGVMAVSMPFLYFSRDSYTELLALTFIFGGLALMLYVQKYNANPKLWIFAGLAIGASTLARIDSYLVWLAIIIFIGININNALSKEIVNKKLIYKSILFTFGALMATLVGWLDLTRLSARYYQDIRLFFMDIVYGLVIVAVVATIIVMIMRKAWFNKIVGKLNKEWSEKFIFVSILFFFGIMVLRPWLASLNLPNILESLLSKLAVARTELEKTNAKYSAQWPLWYFGPFLLLGFYGFASRSRSVISKKINNNSAEIASLVLVLAVMVIYFIKPSVAPDHIWASRRQLPIIMPALAVFTVFVMSNIYYKISDKFNHISKGVLGLAIVVVLLIPPFLTSKPMIFVRQDARQSEIEEVCNTLGDNASILWFGRAGLELTMATRAFCKDQAFSTKGANLGSNDFISISKETLYDFLEQSSRDNVRPFIGGYVLQTDLLKEVTSDLDDNNKVHMNNEFNRLERINMSPPRRIVTEYSEIILFDLSN